MQLLVADQGWTWREWLKDGLAGRDLVCLDVADADHGPPGRVFLLHDGKVRRWRLAGSVNPARNPVDLLAGASALFRAAGQDAAVVSFEVRASPLHRQMAVSLCEGGDIAEVLVPEGSELIHEPWPVPARPVRIAEALPEAARIAQRRARWLEMLESCTPHVVPLDHVWLLGVRLGCGRRLHGAPFDGLGPHVEVYGNTLLVVSERDLDEESASQALNLAHATRLSVVSPTAYDGLLCSFVRGTGEDFGIGVVKGVDFEAREAHVLNTAVAPAPLTHLRIGSLRIDETGKETGETKPWAV